MRRLLWQALILLSWRLDMDVYQSGFISRNWETIREIRKPVIAVLGYAMGEAGELALACDIIIASESAQFALPEIKLAMLPGAGGTRRLPRAIGKAKAMDMCLSARTMSAQEADRYGLISRVVPDSQLQELALKLASQIAGILNAGSDGYQRMQLIVHTNLTLAQRVFCLRGVSYMRALQVLMRMKVCGLSLIKEIQIFNIAKNGTR
jgi:enoyl-CoA hydratase/carnithine racemase